MGLSLLVLDLDTSHRYLGMWIGCLGQHRADGRIDGQTLLQW